LRPRLSVFRSSRHIYVQAINDDSGKTIGEASSLSEEIKVACANAKKAESAKVVGALVGKRLKDLGVVSAVFDRGIYIYHGRVKALAEGAREAGLEF
jgi:large subunit ribosomal protein L18